MTAEPGGGMPLVSGPGQACLDALRCAAFLGQQHPQDLKQAILDHTTACSGPTATAEVGGHPGGLRWLEALLSLLQDVVGKAGSRRRRREKGRRREQGVENEQGQAGDDEEEYATVRRRVMGACYSGACGLMRRAWRVGCGLCAEQASEEEEEDEGAEASGGAWAGEGPAGGQRVPSKQLPEEQGVMEVDPVVSVSPATRPRADLVMSSSSRRGGVVRQTAVAEALSSGDVVGSIFSFVVGVGEASTGRQSVRQLGQLGLVCRKWREVSLWEMWWTDAAEEMLPVSVWRGSGGRGGGRSRRRVLEHGRMVWCARRVWCGQEGWTRGLSIHFEVFDRMDGLQMLSARGPLHFKTPEDGGGAVLRIAAGRRWEVGRPFSAASRDPEQRRFQSMRDFFRRGHEAGFASSVCVRVSVMDERTGRRALLWEEEGKQVQRAVGEVPAVVQLLVGEGSFVVGPLKPQPVTCPVYSGPQLQGRVGFGVLLSVVGQAEGVSEQDRLYQLAGGDEERYEEHESLVMFQLSDGDMDDPSAPPVDVGAVGRFVRSVLGQG